MEPCCKYRDFEYYARFEYFVRLLVSMFGWPVVIAILMLASR